MKYLGKKPWAGPLGPGGRTTSLRRQKKRSHFNNGTGGYPKVFWSTSPDGEKEVGASAPRRKVRGY